MVSARLRCEGADGPGRVALTMARRTGLHADSDVRRSRPGFDAHPHAGARRRPQPSLSATPSTCDRRCATRCRNVRRSRSPLHLISDFNQQREDMSGAPFRIGCGISAGSAGRPAVSDTAAFEAASRRAQARFDSFAGHVELDRRSTRAERGCSRAELYDARYITLPEPALQAARPPGAAMVEGNRPPAARRHVCLKLAVGRAATGRNRYGHTPTRTARLTLEIGDRRSMKVASNLSASPNSCRVISVSRSASPRT